MNFYEQPPSKQWAALTYQGKSFAEVWFKPEGGPLALTFRIPQKSFQIPGLGQHLTTLNLLKAVGIAAEYVESWHHKGESLSGMNESNHELSHPLPAPSEDLPYLTIFVSLKPRLQPVAVNESTDAEISSAKWQALETRWNAVLGLEVSVDTLRLRMEGLRAEMEAALNKALVGDEKVHALNADVAQWNKAKSRARHVLPKVKEFLHRATWAIGTPERKKLEEFFKNDNRAEIPLPQMDQVRDEIEHLLKDKQILSAQGMTVFQDCKNSTADINAALRALQSNAHKRRVASRAKGKSF